MTGAAKCKAEEDCAGEVIGFSGGGVVPLIAMIASVYFTIPWFRL